MTTIEMLKELVENGGMFEHHAPGYTVIDYVKLTDSGIVFVNKKTDEIEQIFELDAIILSNEWKPYVKPVDWTKVPIDTKVLCTIPSGIQQRRHFAGIVDGKPATWFDGATSWSNNAIDKYTDWHTVELAE